MGGKIGRFSNCVILTVIFGVIAFIRVSSAKAEELKCLTVDDFRGFGRCTSVTEVIAKVGEPKEDKCSGVYCPVFLLCDGKTVRLYALNNDEIQSMKVMNDEKVVEVLISAVMKRVNCSKAKNRG